MLDEINYKSNILSKQKNRPIALFHFNPHRSYLLLGAHTKKYQIEKVNAGGFDFWNVTVDAADNTIYSVFVLDHRIDPEAAPKIVIAGNAVNDEPLKE